MIAANGRLCHYAELLVPWSGRWQARVRLDGAVPSGRITLSWGNATLIGGLDGRDSGTWQGEACATIVGGPGWSNVLPAQWHQNDAGLSGAVIAQQCAALCGETLVAPASAFRALRVSYSRAKRSALATLVNVLADGSAYWVEYDGTTKAGARPVTNAPKRVEVLEYAPGTRIVDLDADDISQTLVGSVIAAAPPRRPDALRIVELWAKADAAGQHIRAGVEIA